MIDFLTTGPIEEGAGAALLVGVGADNAFDSGAAWVIEQAPWISARLEAKEFTGSRGEIAVFASGEAVQYSEVAFVGLGESPTAEDVRGAAGSAARSLSKAMTQLCACVPRTGMPKRRPARTFEVAAQPPI